MKIIGITGGVGCGKSEVLAFIEKNYDAAVVRADEVGRDLMRPGTDCTRQILALFGGKAADDSGKLDRAWIADQIFHDPEKRDALNAIVHPAVRREVCRLIEQNRACGWKYFFLESAILIEADYRDICDEIWYIHVEKEQRIGRLLAGRGGSREKWEAFIANQPEDAFFRKNTDVTIENQGSFPELRTNIRREVQRLFLKYVGKSAIIS